MIKKLHIKAAVIDENRVWLVSKEVLSLLCYDLETANISKIIVLPSNSDYCEYNSIVKIGKKICIMPEFSVDDIVVYDIDKDIRYTPEEFKALFQGYFDAARYILFASVVVLCLEIPCIGIMLVFLGLFVSTNPDKKI